MIRRTLPVVAAVLALALAGVGSATAAPLAPAVPTVPTVTAGSALTVGPVPLPGVTLKVCVDSTCRTTPQVRTLTLTLKGAAGVVGAAPVLVPTACPSGVGIGVKTVPGSLGTVTGTVTLATTAAGTVTLPVSQDVTTTHGLAVSACSV